MKNNPMIWRGECETCGVGILPSDSRQIVTRDAQLHKLLTKCESVIIYAQVDQPRVVAIAEPV